MTSPALNEFTAVNITGLYMTSSYLEYNITEIKPNEKMIFNYNVTSDTISDSQIPWAYMSFYDNWTDLQEDIRSQNRFLLSFIVGTESYPTYLPAWDIGKTIPEIWAWIIFAVVPAVIAAIAAFVLYIKRR
jgi:ABC-type phosphate/phosphonate transport system permease subunit